MLPGVIGGGDAALKEWIRGKTFACNGLPPRALLDHEAYRASGGKGLGRKMRIVATLRQFDANIPVSKTQYNGEIPMSEMKLKVSEKGGVSLYGLGRFPVTLYKAQWEKLLGEVDNIRKFLDENADKLAVKE